MNFLLKYKSTIVKLIVVFIILFFVFTNEINLNPADDAPHTLTADNTILEKASNLTVDSLPEDDRFKIAAETAVLQLKVDPSTGHFIVMDKRNGNAFRSYPNPEQWKLETVKGLWLDRLKSPIMYSYVQLNVRRDQEKESNFIADNGKIIDFKLIDNGFQLIFDIPERGFEIPIEVTVKDDFVETRIVDEKIVEQKINLAGMNNEILKQTLQRGESFDISAIKDKKLSDLIAKATRNVHSLVSVQLYPFFGAEQSVGQDGYLMIPDGPGAIIRFKPDRGNSKDYYNERIYGDDLAFSFNKQMSEREYIKAPVFGIKSDDRAFLAQVKQGEEYARIIASPSGSFSAYNWATAAQLYRTTYYQPTSTDRKEGFITYTKDRFNYDRVTRYYLLDKEKANYSGMAERYRKHLMDEVGLTQLPMNNKNIPMQISLLGGGPEEGFLRDTYLSVTNTEHAKQIIDELTNSGIKNMSVNYIGWETEGEGVYGQSFPVARKLGGNEGMENFVNHAHSKGITVYLDAGSYSFNNTDKGGFNRRRDGLRDLAGSIIEFDNGPEGMVTLVSNLFIEQRIRSDMENFKKIGADGLVFNYDIGRFLNSDFNTKYDADRVEAKNIHNSTIQYAKQMLGNVKVREGNLYTLQFVDHINNIAQDYSYDIFVDETIPFVQMALHGLVTYSGQFANLSDDYTKSFLKSMEYGTLPSFALSYIKSQKLLNTIGFNWFYSTNYLDWKDEMVNQYEQFNEVLSNVQREFIINHRSLAEGVKETTYSNGKIIIVNYNQEPYQNNGITVKGENYTVIEGGK